MSDQTSDELLEHLLDGFHGGSREEFRRLLTDKDRILRKMCEHAERVAKKRRIEPWSVISDITGHGSGVSSAIYHLYRERTDDNQRGAT
jgi:hypothetical protein